MFVGSPQIAVLLQQLVAQLTTPSGWLIRTVPKNRDCWLVYPDGETPAGGSENDSYPTLTLRK